MEYANIKEWLDKLIQNKEELKKLVNFNSRISTYYVDNSIPINDHIEEISDIMGAKLIEKIKKKEDEFYHYHFMYKGYRIHQLSEERIERFAGTD